MMKPDEKNKHKGKTYRTYYFNELGDPLNADVEIDYRKERMLGRTRSTSPQEATDTVLIVKPDSGTKLRITLSGNKSKSEIWSEHDGEFIPSLYDYYWISRGRDMYNRINNPAKKQQGGTMNSEQDELKLALLGYVVATKKQPQSEEEINQIVQALVQLKQQDPQQFAQLVQLGQQAQTEQQAQAAKRGAKLNYLRSLKGNCPEGEEVVYFQKGGNICKKCEKKKQEILKKKFNSIEELKKGKRLKKCQNGDKIPTTELHHYLNDENSLKKVSPDKAKPVLPVTPYGNDTIYNKLMKLRNPSLRELIPEDIIQQIEKQVFDNYLDKVNKVDEVNKVSEVNKQQIQQINRKQAIYNYLDAVNEFNNKKNIYESR